MNKIATTVIMIFALVACGPGENDSVRQAHEQNINSAISEDISEFMTQAADARMMNIEQAKLAIEKGTTPAIRQYGQLMITDQNQMLKDLRMLAASKNIVLPNSLSNKKADGLEDLREKNGEEFDEKFINMMTIDHRRDVDEFDDATELKDDDVRRFAERYLPVVEAHLEQIQELKDNRQVSER